MGGSGAVGCGNYGTENKAPNWTYAVVRDYFTAVNEAHHRPLNRSICIDPSMTDHDAANDWGVLND